MDVIIALLISYGYWGMLITAFVAGSFFPFSSEAVMMGLLAAGLDPWGLIIYGTIGNVAGGMFNFTVGRMGKLEWIEKIPARQQRTTRQGDTLHGGTWCLDGFFRLRAYPRQCHHPSS
jgi:Predicted membrane protein